MDDAGTVVGLEAAIEIDHATDKARVEDANAAVIEKGLMPLASPSSEKTV